MKLDQAGIVEHLKGTPLWHREGDLIRRKLEFADFKKAMQFVNKVADLAEAANHHPDITINWNKVTLTLSTHSEDGLTEKDFALAQQIDSI